jgi:hypothetical protein
MKRPVTRMMRLGALIQAIQTPNYFELTPERQEALIRKIALRNSDRAQ